MKLSTRKKIEKARREKRITFAELSRMTGLSYQTIIGIEKNYKRQRNPSVVTLIKIARALGLDAKELIA